MNDAKSNREAETLIAGPQKLRARNSSATPLARFRQTSAASALLIFMSFGAAATFHAPKASAEAGAVNHKIRSAHFIVHKLEKKGFKVSDVRRKAQVYFVKVGKGPSTAVLAVDGYSAEIIGLTLVNAGAGVTPKPRGSGPRHFVDLVYEFGYIIPIAVYESYTVISSTEISSTSSYTSVSYSESEEVTYDAVEHDAASDLDDGTSGDSVGDKQADDNNDADDGTADDADGGVDTGNSADEGGAADDSGNDGESDSGSNDDGGGSDDSSDGGGSGGNDDSGGGSDDSGGSDDGGDG